MIPFRFPDRPLFLRRGVLALVFALATPLLASQAPVSAPAPDPATKSVVTPLLVNERQPCAGVLSGGAPATAEGFQALAAAGYRTFLDLRSDAEVTAETRGQVEAAGLAYERIAISGETELDLTSARRLDALLDDASRLPMVVACGSGNRAGAMLAVRAFWLEGAKAEDALEIGRRGGLTKLEPSVRLLLGLPPAPPLPVAAPAPDPSPPPPENGEPHA